MQTQQSRGRTLSILLTAFIAIACLATILFNQLTLQAMEFHTRDYTYYLQFAAKLLHDRLTPHYSLNPEGPNFLGFHGIDGEAGLHQAVHIEPIKSLDALVYAIFRTSTALIVWRSLLFFAPILYFLRVFPTPTPSDRRFAALFVLLYCLYPATPMAAVYDLRPFGLLAPAFLAFNTLFLARTALIFEFRQRLDPTQTHTLCDYTTHQAFYDFEYLYVYERLPAYLIPSQERLYPANIAALTRLLHEEIEYIIISRGEQATIDDLIARAGIAARVRPLAANDRYVILAVARP